MSEEIIIDEKSYISSRRASELSGYSQDYIGQLSRGGQIDARRVGGLWYISAESLGKHKEKADSYDPAPPPIQDRPEETDAVISFDGRSYVSAAKASKLTGYTQDYVGQLARGGNILARQIGNRWYIDREAILEHKDSKDSLLAAVQTESVGLKHKQPTIRDAYADASDDLGSEPLLEYTSDDRELMPVMKAEENAPAQEEKGSIVARHPIPIHVVQSKMPVRPGAIDDEYKPKNHWIRFARVPKAAYVVLPIAAVVVVLSLGIVSLKNLSVYTLNEEKGGGHSTQTASATDSGGSNTMLETAKTFIDDLGGFLEEHFVPELMYRQM